MHSLLLDLRHATRSLLKRPAFGAMVITVLALCIGANTAIFSVVDAVLLKPLPFRDPGRLVLVSEHLPAIMQGRIPFSAPDYQELRRAAHSFESLGIYRGKDFELSGVASPERLEGARISASLFPTLGISPSLGRNFTAEEDRNAHRVVILSDALWRAKFGSDPDVLGKQLLLDRLPYTIVGVMPKDITFPLRGPRFNNDPGSFYVPISFSKDELEGFGTMYNHSVIGRLRPGVTLAEAQAELTAFDARLMAMYPPDLRTSQERISLSATLLREEVVGDVRPMLLVLFAAVSLVLLIGCADIAALLLTRAAGRQREMSIRTALGANRGQLVRQVSIESLLLALPGGALGLIFCAWGGSVLFHLTGANTPSDGIHFDPRILLFTLTLSLATALVFGLVPAIRASQVDVSQGVHECGRGHTAGRKQGRLLDALVTAQFALALLLLVGAGLPLRSFSHLLATNPGFRPDHVLSMSVSLPGQAYASGASVRSFYTRLEDSLNTLPGVKAAAIATSLPLQINEHRTFSIDGQPATANSLPHDTAQIWPYGDFFTAMGIPLKRGRLFTQQDSKDGGPVVIVNETLARQFWPGRNPVGQRIKWGIDNSKDPWMTVVGVVGDVKQGALTEPTEAETYSPWQQQKDDALADVVTGEMRDMKIVVRTSNSPSAEAPAIEHLVHSLDPSLPVTDVTTMDAAIEESVRAQRFQTTLLGSFAGAALLLASLGIAGVLAYSVAQRVSEIGVRMALGASRSDVLLLVLLRGAKLAAAGTLIGWLCTLLIVRSLAHVLYETSPYDSVTLLAAPAFLCVVGLIAILIPARRAATINPVECLRID